MDPDLIFQAQAIVQKRLTQAKPWTPELLEILAKLYNFNEDWEAYFEQQMPDETRSLDLIIGLKNNQIQLESLPPEALGFHQSPLLPNVSFKVNPLTNKIFMTGSIGIPRESFLSSHKPVFLIHRSQLQKWANHAKCPVPQSLQQQQRKSFRLFPESSISNCNNIHKLKDCKFCEGKTPEEMNTIEQMLQSLPEDTSLIDDLALNLLDTVSIPVTDKTLEKFAKEAVLDQTLNLEEHQHYQEIKLFLTNMEVDKMERDLKDELNKDISLLCPACTPDPNCSSCKMLSSNRTFQDVTIMEQLSRNTREVIVDGKKRIQSKYIYARDPSTVFKPENSNKASALAHSTRLKNELAKKEA